jgi:alcohol dehydrogenase YqhD (iron-dependent ADH family)
LGERIYLPWNDDSVYWSGGDADYIWSEVYIVKEVASAVDMAGGYLPEDHAWDWLEKRVEKEKIEKFRKIVIRVNGKEKEKDESVKIGISDIVKTFESYGIKTKKDNFGVKVEITRKRFE